MQIACATHWYTAVLFLAPLALVGGGLWLSGRGGPMRRSRNRSHGGRSAGRGALVPVQRTVEPDSGGSDAGSSRGHTVVGVRCAA